MRNPSAEEEATRDGATLNAFTVSAVAKKVSTLRTADYFAASADLASFDEILARPGGAPPPRPDPGRLARLGTQAGGVQKAPTHEVAGSVEQAGQRALWGFEFPADHDGGREAGASRHGGVQKPAQKSTLLERHFDNNLPPRRIFALWTPSRWP